MLEEIKERVYRANLQLQKNGLVLYTWGNVSEIDRKSGCVVIKPSGVSYEEMSVEDMVVVSLDGRVIEGSLKPSSDTQTHLELYCAFPQLGGITHTHSTYATAWAQSGRNIPCYGTTHADYFYGEIPCARALTEKEIANEYEKNTGKVMVSTFHERELSPQKLPSMLVKNHGVFAFGKDANASVYHATVAEEVAKIAYLTEKLDKFVAPADGFLIEKHYQRKHGKNAYYGQEGNG